MDAETEQPLIELTSHDDLSYLIANVRAAAAEHIEQAFPRVEGQRGKNTLRTEVEALVNQVCHSVNHTRVHKVPSFTCILTVFVY